MTIDQAAKAGISRLRLPAWNPDAWLEIHLVDGGFYGPWAKLHDVGVEPDGLLIPIFQIWGESTWEACSEPVE